jgi:hypothetical protein
MQAKKQRIQQDSPGEHPYDHLMPIIRAEKSWGNFNPRGFIYDPKLGEWTAYMSKPLHIDRLREMFELPDSITLADGVIESNGIKIRDTSIHDRRNLIHITYTDPRSMWPPSVVRFVDRLRAWSGGNNQQG